MMSKNSWIAGITVAAAMAISGVAQADWTGYAGEPGGAAFTDYCPGTYWITGFNVRAGNYIDAIQASCANGTLTPFRGGPGGSPSQLNCMSPRLVKGVQAYAGWYVDTMRAVCFNPSTSSTSYTPWAGAAGGSYVSLNCGTSGQYAGGIGGDAGTLLDRLRLWCD